MLHRGHVFGLRGLMRCPEVTPRAVTTDLRVMARTDAEGCADMLADGLAG